MMTEPQRPILRYHGGKWRLAPWIISQFPPHKIYVEPFCGAASVLMRKPKSKIEIINDRYDRIVNAFKTLRDPDQSAQLARQLQLTPYAENEYLAAREPADNPIEDARRLIVLGHQGHGSVAASGGRLSGWRRGIRPHGRTSADEWTGLHHHIAAWSDRLRGVYLENTDAIEIIQRWDGPETLFYVDPPYTEETRTEGLRGYAHEMTDDQHRELADTLSRIQGTALISGYSCDLYDKELYPHWKRIERAAMADSGKKATEVLWISPNTPEANQSQLDLFETDKGEEAA